MIFSTINILPSLHPEYLRCHVSFHCVVEQGLREPDIATIYTTGDAQLALDLLHKWNVRYVIFSPVEQRYIQDLCNSGSRACNLTRATRKFEISLTQVFQQGELIIYSVPPPDE